MTRSRGKALARFEVTIHYREPGYASTRGIPERDYRGSFEVNARTQTEAEELAVQQFKQAWSISGVGWERRITHISCKQLGEPEE